MDAKATAAEVTAALVALGYQATDERFNNFVTVTLADGRICALGTVNGPWEADVYRSEADYLDLINQQSWQLGALDASATTLARMFDQRATGKDGGL